MYSGIVNIEIVFTDFQDLFPERDLSAGQLTVITLSQHTANDMSGWSQDVEKEREDLLANVCFCRASS